MKRLEYEDIQGLLRFGYGYLPYSRYLFLRMGAERRARAQAKQWLGTLVDEVTTATEQPRAQRPARVLQVALTAGGLVALGLARKKEELTTFLPEFVEGMAERQRALKLGDTGGSAPEHWDFGGPGTKQPHLVLMLFASTQEELTAFYNHHHERYTAAQLKEVFLQDAALRPVAREESSSLPAGSEDKPLFVEPFGYLDGITQVAPKGFGTTEDSKAPRSVKQVEPGEFILGYPNAYKQQAVGPLVPAAMDPQGTLSPSKAHPAWKDLGRNGTYLVIRKLRQDVSAFEQFLEQHSEHLREEAAGADPKELLAAKLMGRWRSGAPLSLCPFKDDPQLGSDVQRNNDFSYAKDPEGMRCPFSSHIRRSNPRDSFSSESPKDSLKSVNRHQLIRRGRPYGSKGGEEGMMFVALNANIARQFEFIQETWVNSPKFQGLYDSRDPIAGDNHDPARPGSQPDAYSVTIPADPVRKRITGVPRFVHVQGGGYFFLPGIQALRFLCALAPRALPHEPGRVAEGASRS
jgi:Dyp-type peroxidase family